MRGKRIRALLGTILAMSILFCGISNISDAKTNTENSINCGSYCSGVITAERNLYMWGSNGTGKVGNGSTTNQLMPVKVLSNVVSVGSCGEHSAALTSDGSLYMWGYNYHGEVGNGSTTNLLTPVKVLSNVSYVCLGGFRFHNGAITNDGNLYLWGSNQYGQIGNGSTTDQLTPVKVLSNVVDVSVGRTHSGAITSDGSLYMWGSNSHGQIGDGSTTNQLTPKKVLSNVSTVSLGDSYSAAITKDGSLYMWGENEYGQVGNGSTTDQLSPKKVLSNAKQVYLTYQYGNGNDHSAALTSDGSLYLWGCNENGEIGNGSTMHQLTPVKVMSNVVSASLGCSHSVAITRNGDLYSWGSNSQGQVGNESSKNQLTPVRVLQNIAMVSAGSFHTGAITNDGKLYSWGYNYAGEVGNGTTNNQSTPVKVLDSILPSNTKDTDGDGLMDEWELYGADVDNDGIVDIHLEKMGADPNVPDIFVEVDWMYRKEQKKQLLLGSITIQKEINLVPSAEAMKIVYQQFKKHGLNLHIDMGKDSVDYVTGKKWGNLSGGNALEYSQNTNLGTNFEVWSNIAATNFAAKRQSIFRYCIFINNYNNSNSSGIANNIPGQYFIVADLDGRVSGMGDTAVAGTFMHELGHTLGLSHGGITSTGSNDHTHYKPNYLSIMNYLYQFSGLVGGNGSNVVNYCEYGLPEINEFNIDENKGIDPFGVTSGSKLGAKWNEGKDTVYNISGAAIDFNKNKKIETNLKIDINSDGSLSTLQAVTNDWKNITIKGGAIGGCGENIEESVEVVVNEETLEMNKEITIEEAIEKDLIANPGACIINGIVPEHTYANVPQQEIIIEISNLSNVETKATLNVFSELLDSTFQKTIMIPEKNEEQNVTVQIPIREDLKEGNYLITCELVRENGITETLNKEIVAVEPNNVKISTGEMLDLIPDPELKTMSIDWKSNDENIAIVEDGILIAKEIGKTYITGVVEKSEKIICKVEVVENSGIGNKDNVSRIFGSTRYETSYEIADVLKKQLNVDAFDTVIIADGRNFPDALAGSYLAGKVNAPILMANEAPQYAEMLKNYIRENLESNGTIYVLGGTGAVPDSVLSGLTNYNVKRLAGKDRYETNLFILQEAGVTNEDILVCTGNGFADSLSASATGKPILLVNNISLTEKQIEFLENHVGNRYYIIGGAGAINQEMELEIQKYGEAERISGTDRYATSIAVAEEFFDKSKLVVLAYAQNFPDGLCGGPLAMNKNAPLVLTDDGATDMALKYVSEHQIKGGTVLGGKSLISDDAVRKILKLSSDAMIIVK